ncbi:MAG TPA: Hpt domain-containing protein [Gammaproteobacteria bacterium]|jgi:chemosensory pili system protein ChpA (sensor histidine kinase/response regulator)|nr:Hpt domain-containing protein [Gammaproteobacteria bacterium]
MSQVASDSLMWIKNELDHTLVRARQALETYVEKAEDKEALGQCLELLHQVQGTLRIVEVYGAAMLAEEMESVVRGFDTGEVARSDTAFEVLMRAMLQLPDYLERVIGGRRDMPLALLSLLNDLRTVRGQPLLSESALFAYNLAGRSTTSMAAQVPAPKAVDVKGLAAKVRPKFQSALLGWYKGDDAPKHLAVLADSAEKLEQAATTPTVFELWWIVGGIIEGLREGGIEADVSLKQLLGQVDRQMKKLMEQGEAQAAEEPAQELVNNLLYYIGRASTEGKRIAAIKESFKLGDLLPHESELAEARDSLSGPNVNLMRTVSGAIREDISRIKDTLDIFVRMGKSDTGELAPLDELIKKVGDTLTVLGLPKLNLELEAQRKNLQQLLAAKRAPEEAELMEIASGIVRVESGLDDAINELISPDGPKTGIGADSGSQAEMREVQSAVIRESIINMARVKEAIVEFVNDPAHREVLKPLPRHMREIQASFRFLDMQRVVELLASLRQYILKRLLSGKGAPPQNELDRMADAIVSMEFYLETVQQGRGNPLSMLDNAEACVAALGFPVGEDYPEEGDPYVSTGTASGNLEESMPGESIVMEGVAVEDISLSEGPSEDPTIMKEEPTIMEEHAPPVMKQKAAAKQAAKPGAATPVPPSAAGPAVVMSADVDPEIVEIFLEEAQEEMNSLRESFPRWRSNPADREALATMRRSFHTLKGSGRMVGARLIGEFAWAIENMLNRVIDQTVTPSDDMFALIDMSIAALPELVEQLEVGTAPKVNVQPMMDTALAMSRGEEPALPGAADMVPAPAEEPTMIRPAGMQISGAEEPTVIMPRVEVLPPAVSMDPVLYEIFKREAEGHLAVIEAFRVQAMTDRTVTEDVVRALHTLHGSSALAGATNLATLTEPLHRYVAALHEQAQLLPAEHIALMGDSLRTAHAMLIALGSGQTLPVPKGLLGRLKTLRTEALGESFGEDIVMSGPAEVETPAAQPKAKQAAKAPEKRPDKPLKFVQLSDLKDFDPDLAAIFFEEANELLESTDNSLHQWSQDKTDSGLVTQLQRNLHTLKGGARMAGLTPMGDLSHEMETVLTDVVDGRIAASTEMFILLNRAVDRLHRMMEQAYANQPIFDAGDLVLDLKRVHGHTVDEELEPQSADERFESITLLSPPPIIDHTAEGVQTRSTPGRASLPVETQAAAEAEPDEAAEAALGGDSERRTGSRIQYELVRVRADLLEHALNHAGEVGIYRSRLEQQVNTINFNLGELEQTVVRLRDQLRNLEIETEAQIRSQYVKDAGDQINPDFDPLELDQFSTLQQLSRALAESVGDLVSIQGLLTNQAREAETLLLQQSRVTTELQDGLMRTRMVPFSRHAQRLRRVVRQTADEENKQVEVKFIGAEGEMDRQVLERVLAPLEHMLRNSVVHGIEDGKTRKQRKKPAAGTISIALHREGSEVVMEVMDDGAGLNIKAIRKKAEELGMTTKDARLSERDIMLFVLEPGFSTAAKVTQSAGRGVGMDVVASEIKQLGGTLRMDSTEAQGAKFTVRLPFTLSITQALLVRVAEQPYAVPLPAIEAIARIPRMQLEQLMAGEDPVYVYGGRQYRLRHLSVLLGIGAPQFPEDLTAIPLLLVRSGDSSIALITEGMQGSREVVVKSVGPQVSSIRGLSGATILGDGSILLILDVTALARTIALPEADRIVVEEREVPQEDVRTFAMVVDDSITVRRVTQRLLERYNMRVITAKDGVDALALLQENIPDVMLLDIEMPRMDGYELAQHMRNDERFQKIPIIMITSRTGEKHRNRAMEIGVNKYLGKPYQETELLENIQELVGTFNPQRTSW